MKRFIDLRGQILPDSEAPRFAWFDTVVDRFETHSDCQEWQSWGGFEGDFEGTDLGRYRALAPDWTGVRNTP